MPTERAVARYVSRGTRGRRLGTAAPAFTVSPVRLGQDSERAPARWPPPSAGGWD